MAQLVKNESSRQVRMMNIASFYLKLYEIRGDNKCISCSDFRDLMLKKMGIDNYSWDVEDKAAGKSNSEYRRFGDYKASGDAIGGHGLKLETDRTNKGRVLLFNENNLKICSDFLTTTILSKVNKCNIDVDGIPFEIVNDNREIVKPKTTSNGPLPWTPEPIYEAKLSSIHDYLNHIKNLFMCKLDFNGVKYSFNTSSPTEFFERLYPMAVDSDGSSMSKSDLLDIIDKLSKNKPGEKYNYRIFLNASTYQRLYGAHTSGKSVFQVAC